MSSTQRAVFNNRQTLLEATARCNSFQSNNGFVGARSFTSASNRLRNKNTNLKDDTLLAGDHGTPKAMPDLGIPKDDYTDKDGGKSKAMPDLGVPKDNYTDQKDGKEETDFGKPKERYSKQGSHEDDDKRSGGMSCFLSDMAKEGTIKAVDTGLNVGEMAKRTVDVAWDVAKETAEKIKEKVAGDSGKERKGHDHGSLDRKGYDRDAIDKKVEDLRKHAS